MKSFILAACILACTVGIANAQRELGGYGGGGVGTGIAYSKRVCSSGPFWNGTAWSIADKAWCTTPQQQAQPQQVRKPIRRR